MKPSWALDKRDPSFIEFLFPFWDWMYNNYFKVKSDGWSNIPKEKVLLVGSHNGGLSSPDLQMIMYDWYRRFGTERPVYGLMHEKMWEGMPGIAYLVQKLGGIAAHPKVAMQAFEKGASILVFPGGSQDVFRPFSEWDKIQFADRKGFIKLALKESVPIVPIVTVGAHHTLIVLGDLYPVLKQLNNAGMPWPFGIEPEVYPLFIGAPWGLCAGPMLNIPFPVPIYTRVCSPIDLSKEGNQALWNDKEFVDHCYHKVKNEMQQQLDKLIEDSVYRKSLAGVPSLRLNF